MQAFLNMPAPRPIFEAERDIVTGLFSYFTPIIVPSLSCLLSSEDAGHGAESSHVTREANSQAFICASRERR